MLRLNHVFFIIFLSFASASLSAQFRAIDPKTSTPAIFFDQHQEELGLTPNDEMKVLRSFTDKYGWTRTKYQQYHNDIEVKGAVYTLHIKNGELLKGSGIIAENINISQSRSVDISDRIQRLAESYKEEVRSTIIDTFIMAREYPEQRGGYLVAYAIEVENNNPAEPIKEHIYISANTGKTLYKETKILHQSTPAVANTKYYGQQDIITQETEDGYILRDTTRGAGVITVNGQDRQFGSDHNYGDFTNDSTEWTWDGSWETEVSTDAHYCASRYYDWMDDLFGWQGVDGFGGELICINNVVGKFYVNAYWNGTATHYGNGDCANYDPLTTLDVVGHEFAHGFTEFSSGLIYRNQSGALNESISDIIGKGLEYYFDFDNFNWYIGEKFRINEDANPFRSMSDPTERFDPKFYAGDFWFTSAGDNGGVHSNSGVLNYWFYLLVEGETGTNEEDYEYNVQSIGIQNALDIVYGMQIGYLTENSTYFDAMYATLEVADDFWGEGSYEYNQVKEAWLTVGLYEGIDDYDLSIEVVEEDIYLCPGEVLTIDIIIRNVGRLDYDASEVTIEWQPFQTYASSTTVELPSSFSPGDSLIVSSGIVPHEYGDYEIDLMVDELHILNNDTEANIHISSTEGKDIIVEDFQWRYDDACDASSVEGIRLSLYNAGCELIPDNDTLYLSFQTSNGIVENIQPIWFDFAPGRSSTFSYWITPDEVDFSEVTSVFARVNGESDLEQNSIVVPDLTAPNSIADGYLDDMEDNAIPDFFITGSVWATTDSIINYKGNMVLAVAGRSSATSFINCPDIEDFYDGNYQKKSINYCVDATGMENPEFRFDLLSKTRLYDANADVPYHTMVYIEIPGIEPYIITTSQDDTWEKQAIPLPIDFNDEFSITAFVLSGQATFDLPDLEDSDYLLFDNLRLVEQSLVSTEEEPDRNQLVVSPNPATDQLTIMDVNEIDSYQITDMNGSIILAQDNVPFRKIDISSLANGVFILTAFDNTRPIGATKIIKIE